MGNKIYGVILWYSSDDYYCSDYNFYLGFYSTEDYAMDEFNKFSDEDIICENLTQITSSYNCYYPDKLESSGFGSYSISWETHTEQPFCPPADGIVKITKEATVKHIPADNQYVMCNEYIVVGVVEIDIVK